MPIEELRWTGATLVETLFPIQTYFNYSEDLFQQQQSSPKEEQKSLRAFYVDFYFTKSCKICCHKQVRLKMKTYNFDNSSIPLVNQKLFDCDTDIPLIICQVLADDICNYWFNSASPKIENNVAITKYVWKRRHIISTIVWFLLSIKSYEMEHKS